MATKPSSIKPLDKGTNEYFAHKDGTVGGALVGKKHSDAGGGIKAKVKDTGQEILVESDEVIINKTSVQDPTLHEFNGKQMTNRQILSAINVSSGKGVAFAEGGEVPTSIKTTGKKYTYNGKRMPDYEIVSGCGCKHAQEAANKSKMAEGGEIEDEEENYDDDDQPSPEGLNISSPKAYLMTQEQYVKDVVPVLKEYKQFLKKNNYFISITYGGLYMMSYPELEEIMKNKGSVQGSIYFDFTHVKSYETPEKQLNSGWVGGSHYKGYTSPDKDAPAAAIKKKDEFEAQLRGFYGNQFFERALRESDNLKSNKRAIRFAIERGIYKKLLEDGKVEVSQLKTYSDSAGVKIPKKITDIDSNAKRDEAYQQIYKEMPTINKGVLTKLVSELTEWFKPLEKIIFDREIERYETLIDKYIALPEIKASIVFSAIDFYEAIFNIGKKETRYEKVLKKKKYGYGTYEETQSIVYLIGLKRKDNYKSALEKQVQWYVDSLKQRFIYTITTNFQKITQPIENYELLQLEHGRTGNFQGEIKFNFKNGSSFVFKTQGIFAGGYNIQPFHIRYISDFLNAHLADGTTIANPPLYQIVQNFSVKEGGENDNSKFATGGAVGDTFEFIHYNSDDVVLPFHYAARVIDNGKHVLYVMYGLNVMDDRLPKYVAIYQIIPINEVERYFSDEVKTIPEAAMLLNMEWASEVGEVLYFNKEKEAKKKAEELMVIGEKRGKALTEIIDYVKVIVNSGDNLSNDNMLSLVHSVFSTKINNNDIPDRSLAAIIEESAIDKRYQQLKDSGKLMARGGKLDKKKTGRLKLSDIPASVKEFMPPNQQQAIVGSEEHWDIIETFQRIIDNMPKSYETENIPINEKILYLRYFYGDSEWYIAEKDMGSPDDAADVGQRQAFGYAILNGDTENAEWGYINIEELKGMRNRRNPLMGGVELDFYFEPIPFGKLQKQLSGEEDEQEEQAKPPIDKQEFISNLAQQRAIEEGKKAGTDKIMPIDISVNGSVKVFTYDEANKNLAWVIKQKVWSDAPYEIEFSDGFVLEGSIDIEPFDFWKDKKTPLSWHLNTFWNNLANHTPDPIYNREVIDRAKNIISKYYLGDATGTDYADKKATTTKRENKPIWQYPFDDFIENVKPEYNTLTKNVDFYLGKPDGSTETLRVNYFLPDQYKNRPNDITAKDFERVLWKYELGEVAEAIENGKDVPQQVINDFIIDPEYDLESPTIRRALNKRQQAQQENNVTPAKSDNTDTNIIPNKWGNKALQFSNDKDITRYKEIYDLFKTSPIGLMELSDGKGITYYWVNKSDWENAGDTFVPIIYERSDVMESGEPTTENRNQVIIQAPKTITSDSAADKVGTKSQAKINNDIRALVAEKGIDRSKYSADELALLKLYEGAGGMAKQGDKGARLLDQYFTPIEVVEKMWGLALKYGFKFKNGNVGEFAVGSGRFLQYIPTDQNTNVVGYDVDETAYKVCKVLFPTFDIRHGSFESMFFKGRRHVGLAGVDQFFDLVITNPPYRPYVSEYAPLGEKEATGATTFEMYFIARGVDVLKKGGLLIMLIPASFINNDSKYNDFKNKLAEKAELIDGYRLPSGIFNQTEVTTDIIVLRKTK